MRPPRIEDRAGQHVGTLAADGQRHRASMVVGRRVGHQPATGVRDRGAGRKRRSAGQEDLLLRLVLPAALVETPLRTGQHDNRAAAAHRPVMVGLDHAAVRVKERIGGVAHAIIDVIAQGVGGLNHAIEAVVHVVHRQVARVRQRQAAAECVFRSSPWP